MIGEVNFTVHRMHRRSHIARKDMPVSRLNHGMPICPDLCGCPKPVPRRTRFGAVNWRKLTFNQAGATAVVRPMAGRSTARGGFRSLPLNEHYRA